MATRIYFSRAERDYSDSGIRKGQLYYSWSTGGAVHRLTKPPRPSQITTSRVIRRVREAREILSDIIDDVYMGGWRTTDDGIVSSVLDISARMQKISSLCARTSLDMGELLAQGTAAEKLSDLASYADGIASQLKSLANELQDEKIDEESFLFLLQKAHALPEWELF